MKNYLIITLHIFIVFIVAITLSFVPDQFPNLFGDWFCKGTTHFIGEKELWECTYAERPHNAEWHWGYRHWLFFLMGLCVFVLHVYRIVILIIEKLK